MAPVVDASRRVPDASVGMQTCRENFATLIRRAEKGQHIVITHHGRPVAGLVSVADLERIAGQADLPKLPKPGRQ